MESIINCKPHLLLSYHLSPSVSLSLPFSLFLFISLSLHLLTLCFRYIFLVSLFLFPFSLPLCFFFALSVFPLISLYSSDCVSSLQNSTFDSYLCLVIAHYLPLSTSPHFFLSPLFSSLSFPAVSLPLPLCYIYVSLPISNLFLSLSNSLSLLISPPRFSRGRITLHLLHGSHHAVARIPPVARQSLHAWALPRPALWYGPVARW